VGVSDCRYHRPGLSAGKGLMLGLELEQSLERLRGVRLFAFVVTKAHNDDGLSGR
jgi:hypothetical protein